MYLELKILVMSVLLYLAILIYYLEVRVRPAPVSAIIIMRGIKRPIHSIISIVNFKSAF